MIIGEPASRITYIYALVDPSGRVRYIGKSDSPKYRFMHHILDKSDTHKARWIRALADCGERPRLLILQAVPFEEWQERERYWIALIKQTGAALTNSTEGGRGPLMPGEETRLRMRAAKIGQKLTPEHRAKVSAALKGKKKPKRTKEHSLALGAACVGRVISQTHRVKLAAANMLRLPSNQSGFKGVYFDRARGKYQALIKISKKIIHLGRHATAREAALAYNNAARANGWPEEGLNKL